MSGGHGHGGHESHGHGGEGFKTGVISKPAGGILSAMLVVSESLKKALDMIGIGKGGGDNSHHDDHGHH